MRNGPGEPTQQPDKGEEALRCLIVDDNEAMRRVIGREVKALGGEVRECDSVAGLDQALCGCHPDLVFLDICLSGSDAIEAVRVLAARNYGGVVQLISGVASDIVESVHRMAERHGFRCPAPLLKPFRRAAIHAAIASARRCLAGGGDPGALHILAARPRLPAGLLTDALEHDCCEFWFQPKIQLSSGKLVGAEALLRVRHPEHGLVLPGDLLVDAPPAIADRLTEKAVLAAMAAWRALAARGVNLRLSVNSSLSVLARLEVAKLIRDSRPSMSDWPGILIEITEDEATRDPTGFEEIATQLKLYGAYFSIDDFGLGHSSLSRLKDLQFVELKLDQSFVRGCAGDGHKAAICRAAIKLANEFGATSVAEGIEGADDLRCLQRMQCDIGQGFYLGEALALGDLVRAASGRARWSDPVVRRGFGAAESRALEGLTARENEVVAYVAQGLSSKEVGLELGISHRTVELHRARSMSKLGARNLADLVRLVMR
jgi:EAL domain-containing protein (putative c-di-GMP-specific phosphodiesterase class I)/FixJ family two-component response regulator